MTAPLSRSQFVENLARVALDGTVTGELTVLTHPPGRRPALDLTSRSEWFNALDHDDQDMVANIMRATAYAVLHSVLCVLDGVATVVEGPEKGQLRLVHETPDGSRDLTDTTGQPDLHDLLAERYRG